MSRLLYLSFLTVLATFLLVCFIYLKSPPSLPKIDLEEWWGPMDKKHIKDESIKNFKVEFNDSMINDLRYRLKTHRRWTPPLEGAGFRYGFNADQLDSWVEYWREEYNFKERAQFLNQFPQYKTKIQGLDIHFVRVKPRVEVSAGVEVVPMLFLHGWPGSVREFYEALPLLTAASKDRDFAIEAIVPSLPGYGFSDAAVRPGLGAVHIGVIFRNLMHRLGFNRFYIQGGDWGSIISTEMATIFPDEILGYHCNMASSGTTRAKIITILGALYPPLVVDHHLADRMYPLTKFFSYMMEEYGYFHIQATKPDSIGVALSDSPSGLLAYILEKFSTWTETEARDSHDGNLGSRWTKDQLLDNLMLYWSSGCITTSMRLYAESNSIKYWELGLDEIPTPVPTWALQAKYELIYQPPLLLRTKYPNLVGVTVLEEGGHFLAFQLPRVFSDDVLKAITAFRRKNVRSEL